MVRLKVGGIGRLDVRDSDRIRGWALAAGFMVLVAMAAIAFGESDREDILLAGNTAQGGEFVPDPAGEIERLEGTIAALMIENDRLTRRLGAVETELAETTTEVARAQPRPVPPYGVELGVFSDQAALYRRWDELNLRAADALDGLEGRLAPRDRGDRMEYVLLAGPFPSSSAAAIRCGTPALAAIGCAPTLFGGSPLSP